MMAWPRTTLPIIVLALAAAIRPAASDTPASPYVIGPGDIVNVAVSGAPDLTGGLTFNVRPDGAISFPWLGEVLVGGKTVAALTEELTQGLSERYRSITVTVNLTKYHERNVFVFGEVATPGAVPMEGDAIGLTQAILAAGGLGPDAAKTGALLYRQGQSPIPVDLTLALTQGTSETNLQPGDVLLVEKEKPKEITILGEVANTGTHPLPPDARVSDILGLAGAPSESGDAHRAILVKRDGQTTIVDIEYLLKNPESPINVPADEVRMFVVPPKADLMVLGEVETQGPVSVGSQDRLLDAVLAAGGLGEAADPGNVRVIHRNGEIRTVDLDEILADPTSDTNILVADVSSIFVGEYARPPEVGFFGEVGSPKALAVEESVLLSSALAEVGGLSEKADPRRIDIFRADGTRETIDVTALLGLRDAPSEAPEIAGKVLYPGDLVVANRRYAEVMVLGAVGSVGPLEFEEGDTVIDIIARAGDFAKKANRKHTAILRRDTDDETVQVIVADMNAALRGSEVLLQYPVQDGDIIYVPDRPTPAWKNLVRTLTGAASFLLVFDRLMD